jgi:xanthine dehydrogenase small subunit
MRSHVRFIRRGKAVEISGADARMTLLDWLRLRDAAVGTKEGCAEGDCGACTVILARTKNGRVVHQPVNACILLAGQADGAEVLTVEDLTPAGSELDPVQEAMLRLHGSQCGFCTPGIVMSLAALHREAPRPVSRQAVCDQLAGNLCRCTGYRPIIEAALEACAMPKPEIPSPRVAAVGALQDNRSIFSGDDAAFFAAPRTEAELGDLLARYPDALVVAGSTDAGLWLTKALISAPRVIWLARVEGLDRIERTGTALTIGATATVADASRELGALAPDFAEVIRRFGSTQVRASATVGGNIANASPIGDLAPCLIALGASLELGAGDAIRTMPLEDFFIAYKKQDRRPGEIVRRISIEFPDPATSFRAYKITKRMDEDISSVLGAFAFHTDGRRITSARIAFGGMAGIPARARATERALAGLDLDAPSTWLSSLDCLAGEFQPLSDHRASAAYRSLVARNLLHKALLEIAGVPLSTTRIVSHGEAAHAGE